MKNLRRLLLAGLSMLAVSAGGAYNYLFIGDSITDGNWGSPKGWPCPSEKRNTADQNHIYGHGYAEMTIGVLASENPDTAVRYFNRGISGNTLSQMADRWDKDALALDPDLVSVLIGINDVHEALKKGEEIDYSAWESKLDSLLTITQERKPDVRIMLGTPFTARVGKVGASSDYGRGIEMTRKLADIVRKVGARHGAAIVSYDELIGKLTADTTHVPASYWLWDGIHPTTQCHALMSRLWLEKYAEQVKELQL